MILKTNSFSSVKCWSESTGWSMSWSRWSRNFSEFLNWYRCESDSNSWFRCESWNRSLSVSVFRYFYVTHSSSKNWRGNI